MWLSLPPRLRSGHGCRGQRNQSNPPARLPAREETRFHRAACAFCFTVELEGPQRQSPARLLPRQSSALR